MVRDNYKKAIEENRVIRWEETSEYPTGVKVGEVSIAPFFDDNGICTHLIGSAHEITEKKKSEEKLRLEKDRLQALMDGLNQTEIGVDIVDMNYKILSQNQFLKERFGDCIGKLCYKVYMNHKNPCGFCPIEKAIKSGKVEKVELTGADGNNYELLSAPLTNPGGTVDRVIEVIRDITERKKIDVILPF